MFGEGGRLWGCAFPHNLAPSFVKIIITTVDKGRAAFLAVYRRMRVFARLDAEFVQELKGQPGCIPNTRTQAVGVLPDASWDDFIGEIRGRLRVPVGVAIGVVVGKHDADCTAISDLRDGDELIVVGSGEGPGGAWRGLEGPGGPATAPPATSSGHAASGGERVVLLPPDAILVVSFVRFWPRSTHHLQASRPRHLLRQGHR